MELRRQGSPLDAANYLLNQSKHLIHDTNFGKLAGQLGATIAANHPRQAIELMRLALRQEEADIAIMNSLERYRRQNHKPVQHER